MHFLYDAINLKQSVEGTLNPQGKSLITVLDEVHFIVNLYSFPTTPAPQGKSFLPQGKSFAPSEAEQLPKFPTPSFSVNPSLLRMSQLPGQNQQNSKQS